MVQPTPAKQTGPLQTLYSDIEKIIDFMEVKNQELADSSETEESRSQAEVWMNAQVHRDSYVTYKNYWTLSMFQEVDNSITLERFHKYLEQPFGVPMKFQELLLERGRKAFLDSYEELNPYYRMLAGLPGTDDTELVYLSDNLAEDLGVDPEIPVHLLPEHIQNAYMNTDEYLWVLENYPGRYYLKYLGRYKINIYAARLAKDFEIIRYPNGRTDINPNLLEKFSKLYADYREYVMVVLYNDAMKDQYHNYRTFMGIMILVFVLLQIGNSAIEAINSRGFLDDVVLYTILSLYGIPEDLVLTKETRRELVLNLLKLIQKKGTSAVYYDLADILAYDHISIYKLMLMKGQQFDESGKAKKAYAPYFLQLDIKDPNPYDTVASGKAPILKYKEVIKGDPTWWDLPDVKAILLNSNYTISESKYIVVESTIHQMELMFESIYLVRMLLDNKRSTETFMVEIPELLGSTQVSLYDLNLFIICAMCMTNGLSGDIREENRLLAVAGFNFDLDMSAMNAYLDSTRYVDKERVRAYLDNLIVLGVSDLKRLYKEVMYPFREWLEDKIVSSTNRREFVEYESIYRAVFTYDINRHRFLDDFEPPLETIREKYGLSHEDMDIFKAFYPNMDNRAVTVEEYNGSSNKTKYHYPFLQVTDEVDWYAHITLDTIANTDRGTLYFYDILNSPDCRLISNKDNTRIFMDYKDEEVGWELNKQAVEKALHLIDTLDPEDLKNAYMQIYTKTDSAAYQAGTYLPAVLRSGTYKSILKEKLQMDLDGLASPPTSYMEALERSNPALYQILTKDNRFQKNRQAWLDDVMVILAAVESALDIHAKYLEYAVGGKDAFFKPLITLIKRFKSILVEIAKTGLSYEFDDKMDIGGWAHMLKLFDEVKLNYNALTGFNPSDSEFGLYDTEHSMHHYVTLNDRTELIKYVLGEGFLAEQRTADMGSIRMVDEAKMWKNGESLNETEWRSGEFGVGRWENDMDFIMKTRKSTKRVETQIDFEGWKDYIVSTPDEE